MPFIQAMKGRAQSSTAHHGLGVFLTSADSLAPPSSCFKRCAFSSAMAAL